MDYTEIRKLSLKVFLAFLGLTALIGIISVLSDFRWFQLNILGTCATVSGASICSMSCAVFIEKKGRVALGLSAIILAVSSAVLLIVGLWWEVIIDIKEYWKTAHSLGIAAIGFAYAFLLVLPALDDKQKWVQRVSSVSIGVLTLQIIVAIWGEINNKGYYQLLTIVAIIVGLESLAIPILVKLRTENGQKRNTLVLEQLEGGIYRNSTGKKYPLKELNSEEDG